MGIDIEVTVKFTSDNPADSTVVADVMTAIGKAQGRTSGGNGGTQPQPPPPPPPAGGEVTPAAAAPRGVTTRR